METKTRETDMTRPVTIRLLSRCDGVTQGLPVGSYLASYDPEANDGQGKATWTREPDQAMKFADGAAAAECYRAIPRNRPVRPDGKPNRPMTVFMVMFDLFRAPSLSRS
jgi:hypothetical protein